MGDPPQRALWLPPLHIHSYHLLSQTDLRAIYFSSSLIAECTSFTKSQQVHVITATPLVKELIAGLFSEDYARPSQRKIALLLLEILSEAPPLTMALPMPNDERLFSAARSLLVNQRWEASLSELAFMSAMSERTFSRLFMKDTGFSFRTWKQRARICASLIFSRTVFQSNRSLTSLVSHARRPLPLLFAAFWGNATRFCALNRETLKAVFETVMGILPDAETLRGQGYPAFAVEKGSLICTRHTLID